jgi:hypothetical protein
MVCGLQMGIQWKRGEQSAIVVRVDVGEEGEGTGWIDGVDWEVGAKGMGRSILERISPMTSG